MKEERNGEADFDISSRRQFVKKFFRKDGHFCYELVVSIFILRSIVLFKDYC